MYLGNSTLKDMNRRSRRSVPDTPILILAVPHSREISYKQRGYAKSRLNGHRYFIFANKAKRFRRRCRDVRRLWYRLGVLGARSIHCMQPRACLHGRTTENVHHLWYFLNFYFQMEDSNACADKLMRTSKWHDLFSPPMFIMTYFTSWPYRRCVLFFFISIFSSSPFARCVVFLPLGKSPSPWQRLERENGEGGGLGFN